MYLDSDRETQESERARGNTKELFPAPRQLSHYVLGRPSDFTLPSAAHFGLQVGETGGKLEQATLLHTRTYVHSSTHICVLAIPSATHETHTCSIRDRVPDIAKKAVYEHSIYYITSQYSIAHQT